jgi:hypothetical protein
MTGTSGCIVIRGGGLETGTRFDFGGIVERELWTCPLERIVLI